jgi:type II secretory pathway pseudopilin PulG
MNREHNRKQAGFTLIELTLAMSFISALLLAIAMTVIQISHIYNKGMALKEVNQSARDVTDMVRRSLVDAPSFDPTQDYRTNSAGGRLCLGNYSYIWNTEKALDAGDVNLTNFEKEPATGWDADSEVRLVRVQDPARVYCARTATNALIQKAIRSEDADKTDILLQTSERDIGLLDFRILPATSSPTDTNFDPATNERLVTVLFRLGTGELSAMNPGLTACRPPSDPESNNDFCNVQEFTLAARAGSGVN